MQPTKAPQSVIDAIMYVRDLSVTNMFDHVAVVQIMQKAGDKEEAAWVKEHKAEYAKGILYGFEVEERESDAL